MSSSSHSKISPSIFERVFQCPPSVDLVANHNLKSTGGPAADEGTKAHIPAAKRLAYMLGLGGLPDLSAYNKDMIDGAETWCAELSLRMCDCGAQHKLFMVEEEFSLAEIEPDMKGTTDGLIYCRACFTLIVADYKYGHTKVFAKNNRQMLGYGLGFALRFPNLRIDTLILLIVQPRASFGGPSDHWYTTGEELMEFALELRATLRRTRDPAEMYHAGDWCKYCPANGAQVCPEQRALRNQNASKVFDNIQNYDPQKLAEALTAIPAIEAWIKATESFAYSEAAKGKDIPGFKLADKYPGGGRKYRNEQEAINAIAAVSASLALLCMETPALRSPAQVEKVLKDAGWSASQRAALIKPLVVDPVSSGTCLVKETDPRPAHVVDITKIFTEIPENPSEEDLL